MLKQPEGFGRDARLEPYGSTSSKRSVRFTRRSLLGGLAAAAGAGAAVILNQNARARADLLSASQAEMPVGTSTPGSAACLYTKDVVPDPKDITFRVQYPGKGAIELAGHYWFNSEAVAAGRKSPAILEFNPYRRRDGMIVGDSAFYPYFAYHGYLGFRVDIQGSGDSEGLLTDEYTDEELAYCVQLIEQIANHPLCDGNVGMKGHSWSTLNALMVAAHEDCPTALKAILAMAGSDDRYGDDVHYMGGAMMMDNVAWSSSMWGWLSQPPDPATVGDRWKGMWRNRIRNANVWFKKWATHQARDSYWSDTAILSRFDKVKAAVFIVSGYQDGYKNTVTRVVEGLAAAGVPVKGLLGPWGHSTPDLGYPGPQIDWLPNALAWFDEHLKGKKPDTTRELAELTVWLGDADEPDMAPCKEERGRWIAEDAAWAQRVQPRTLYLASGRALVSEQPRAAGHQVSSGQMLLDTNMFETSSWGTCASPTFAGDQRRPDEQSLFFDSAPLEADMDCFGYPEAQLNLASDQPITSLAVRLCEISPETGASHLVTYTFFNLCYRNGDFADPIELEPGAVFDVRIPLGVVGHTFKRGWKVRLSVSPSFFPTLWQTPTVPVITVHTGPVSGSPASKLTLPQRAARSEDDRMAQLLSADSKIVCVDAADYVPTETERESKATSRAEPLVVRGRKGVRVHKVVDAGRYRYGGPLGGLLVDQVAEENFQMLEADPLSLEGFSSMHTVLERSGEYGDWKARSQTTARVWSERDAKGLVFFRYRSTIETFIADEQGAFQPFEDTVVEGSVPRRWI